MDDAVAKELQDWMLRASIRVEARVDEAIAGEGYGTIVGMGADGTPTLQVDRVAEAVVLDMLDEAPVKLDVVSEETAPIRRGGAYTLVIDPVDGSRNLVRKIPFYCVSMAIGRQRQRDVELGLVRNLATGQTYTARKGSGAFLDGGRIRVRRFDPADFIVATALQYERDVARRAGGGFHIRAMGASALETCLVAQGAMDIFIGRTPYLRIIDVSAAALILEEAGGHALGADGTPFDSDFDVTKRIGFIGVGDRKALEAIS